MKSSISLTVVALICSAASAQDQPVRKPSEQPMTPTHAQFETLDRNHDQQLSKSEASADRSVATQFGSLDANADGYISKTEYAAHAERSMKQSDEPE